MTRPADWRERERALDPRHSCIVQAPAGSGKTELLTQRMLRLLAGVENPEEVVAITFTRKAAAEMSRRLVESLLAASAEPRQELQAHEQANRELALAVLENDARRGWNLLLQPSRLRIRTIDGLCSELARQLPVLSGLGGGQQIAEDTGELYRLAAARTMAAIEDENDELQADVIRVLDRYDNQYDRLVGLLTDMLGHREQWIGHLLDLKTGEGFDRAGLEESLRILIEAELRSAREALPDGLLQDMPRFLRYARGNLAQGAEPLDQLLNACVGEVSGRLEFPVSSDALEHWRTLLDFLLTQAGSWRAGPDAKLGFPAPSAVKGEEKAVRLEWKDGFKALLDSLRDDDRLLESLGTVRKLPRPGYDDEAWASIESLMRILIRAFQEWKMVMSETGQADFSEIASRAILALGEDGRPSPLALSLDYRIQHLLVDEFQDTSMSQIHLLDRLTAGWIKGDGRTLFLVGDPMQSIYRFRKAEVSLFIDAFQGRLFRHLGLRPLQLQVNFRSERPVVDWVNAVFPRVMPPHSDPLKDAVHYSASRAKPDATRAGEVTIHIAPQRDDEAEARQVVELIGRSGPEQSIAILVRSRKHAAGILARLDRLKESEPRYRYQAIDFTPLAETPLVQDLVSLTLALSQPADRLAWFSVLRAPWAGLDLSDLDTLAGGSSDGVVADALASALAADPDAASVLGNSGRERLRRVAPVLLEAVGRRGRESVRSVVESAWLGLGGPACAQSASQLDDAAAYFGLLDSLEDEGLPIDRDTLDQRMKDLYAQPDDRASDRLQVMTIFGAKGLQFDTVILPGLNRGTGWDGGKLLHWFELPGQDRIVMSPMRSAEEKERRKKEADLIEFISDVEKSRQRLENGRLLYVAATRAVRNLHLFAAVKPTSKGEVKAAAGTLLGELWPAIREEQAPSVAEAAAELEAAKTGAAHEDEYEPVPQIYRRLAADWRLPPPADGIPQPQTEMPDVSDAIEFRWAGEEARLTGNLVHRLLQQIAERGPESWQDAGGMAVKEAWCRAQLLAEGVTGERADGILEQTKRAIENCLQSEVGRKLLDDHEEAHCELALTAVLDGRPREQILDRTYVLNGERWIIDYKTSTHSGGNLEGFLESESERYREQLERYRQAVALNEERPVRTALYFPLLDRFLEL